MTGRQPGNTAQFSTVTDNAVVDEPWPASATSAAFTVVEGDQCSSATLRLLEVVVQVPDGQRVRLGNIDITSTAWQWVAPFECQLLDDPPNG